MCVNSWLGRVVVNRLGMRRNVYYEQRAGRRWAYACSLWNCNPTSINAAQQPTNTTCAPIDKLSDELLLLIFEQLSDAGRPCLPLKSLRLVCRHFRSIASTLLFKHVAIRYPSIEIMDPTVEASILQSQGLP